MTTEIKDGVNSIITCYDPDEPHVTADLLREFWLQFDPKSMGSIKSELQEKQETVGIPVPILKEIGKTISKVASKRVDDFIPLTRLLWDEYGREGRVVTLISLGAMELVDPETIIPMLKEMCSTCITWEDADRLAMDALEPIVRKKPDQWLSEMESWLADENKWVKRAGVTVIGRLAMKHATYTTHCLELTERLLFDEDTDVKKAVSFAIRLSARGEVAVCRDFLARHVPPENAVATWVLCDAIRSMATKLLPKFVPLLPCYEQWCDDPGLSSKDRRSVESAIKKLQSVGG
jgi:3-methyladenine DNA glycosylase AlkD